MGRLKIFITLATVLFVAGQSFAARQALNENASPSSKGGLNSNFSKANANFIELYSLAIAAPWLAQGTAPSVTNVFWVDTSGASPVIKYWDGDSWEVAAAGGDGSYTLPTASAATKGGIKVGARLSIDGDGVLSADVQSGTGAVDSVNTKTGTVVINPDDLVDTSTTNKFVSAAEKTKLANLSGINTGDQTLPTDATLTTTDVTTNNATTSKHGWLLKATAPASGLRNVVAIDNGETAYTNKALFDATNPSTQAFGDSAAVGSAMTSARRDHKHQMPAAPTTISGNAGTATALAANGGNCSAGQAALGVDASGAAEGCWTPSAGAMTWPTSAGIAVYGGSSAWGSSLSLVTSVGATGADTAIPTEQGVREALNLKANASSIAFEAATWSDLKILDTTHPTAGTGIALVQDSMTYANADDAYHLWSIDKVGSELALKLPVASPTSTGKFTTAASATGGTGFNLPHGTAPTSPVNGDFWTTTLGVYARINGSTVGPFGSSAGITTADIDTSAELRAILGDEVGTGAAYFVGGALGTPASATLTNATGLPLSGVLDSTTEALGAGTIELGHASDTTLARSGAGVVTIEGVAVVTASSTVTKTNLTLDTAGTGNSITVPLNGVLDGAITDPADADDMIYKKVQNAMTLTDIHCLAEGGGTITLTLQECTAAGESCANIETAITCDADGAEDDGTLSDASIAAGAWIKVLYSAPTGTVNNVAWTVYGTQTW